MKKVASFLILLAALSGWLCASPARPEAIARLPLPGKGEKGFCLDYAMALYERLTLAGSSAGIVVYRWNTSSDSGAHAVVIFTGTDGRLYAVDNLSQKPSPLKGSGAREWAANFAGRGVGTTVLTTKINTALADRLTSRARMSGLMTVATR